MKIHLEMDGNTPLYKQIIDKVRHQVAVGALQPGDRLPTVRRLAEELQVDRNTALRAYRILDREGIISLQHGRGTFVRTSATHPRLTEHRRVFLETVVNECIARALSLGYAPAEIEGAFGKRLRHWKRARHEPHKE